MTAFLLNACYTYIHTYIRIHTDKVSGAFVALMLHVGFLFMLNDELAGQAVSDIINKKNY
jgi:hypothetical protein